MPNKRINELAAQAGINGDPVLLEKFAKLVATDCMDIAHVVRDIGAAGLNGATTARERERNSIILKSASIIESRILRQFCIPTKLEDYLSVVEKERQRDTFMDYDIVFSLHHGIPDVVIWIVGTVELGAVICVSNVKNQCGVDNFFVINRHTFEYDEKQVAAWITPHLMNQIKAWITTNTPLINELDDGCFNMSLEEFYGRLVKVVDHGI